MKKRWISVGLILAMLLSILPETVWASEAGMEQQFAAFTELGAAADGEEIFPENSVVEAEDLEAGDEEIFPEGSESGIYTEEDLNAGDEIEIPEGAESGIGGSDEDLGASEELMDNSDSAIYEDESLDAGLGEGKEPTVGLAFSGEPGDEDDLGAPAETLTLAKGSAKQVVFAVDNCYEPYYLQYWTTNSNAYSCSWGNWNGNRMPLTVTGKNPGSGRVYVYLKSARSGKTLASTYIQVTVTAKAKLTLSVSRVSLGVGQSTRVTASFSNYSGIVYMQYGTTNGNVQSCSWGGWSGNSVPLTVTGKQAGSSTVYIYLKDAKTNLVLATASFSVSVTQNARVTASASSVTIRSGSSATVNFTVSGMYGDYYLQYSMASDYAYQCSWGKWNNSTIPLTIQGRNAGSGKVTVYLKSTSGATVASTLIQVTVTAAQSPKVQLSQSSISLRSGNAAVVTATVSNVSSTYYLQYSTTSEDAYRCEWAQQWNGGSINLTITGKKAGSGTVTVYLKRASDHAVLASAKLTVKVEGSGILSNLSYTFSNFSEAASERICRYMFQNRVAAAVFRMRLGDGGNCFGMASTAGMFYAPTNGVLPNNFHASKSAVSQLAMADKNSSWGLTVKEFVQAMQISQVSTRVQRNFVSGSSLSKLVHTVNRDITNFRPTMVCIYGIYGGQNAGHAILAYGVQNVNSTKDRLLIYDNNYPMETRYLDLEKSSGVYTGWSYPLTDDCIWGSSRQNGRIAYLTYSNYLELWENRGALTNGYENLLVANSENLTLCDVDGMVVATVRDGVLDTDNENIQEVVYDSLDLSGDGQNENYILRLPVDLYTVKNEDPTKEQFIVEVVNEELSARVVSTANEVTVCADDSCNLASVLLDTQKDETYQIILGSSREGEPKELEWNGVGTGDTVSVMVEDGSLETCNVSEDGLKVGDMNDASQNQVYTITCTAGANGSISPNGTDLVLSGDHQEYQITPDSGYKVQDVIVDGISIGAVYSYTFEQVWENHTIQATFEKLPANTISAKDVVKTTSKKAQSFQLKVSTKGKAKLSYRSNSKSVKVSDKGRVTIVKNFVGEANIVITAAASADYRVAKKTITITVRPGGVSISKMIGGSKKMTVHWKKNTAVTGYQIQYARSSNFQSSKYVTVKGYQKESKAVSGLKKKKVYYARIRTYKVVSGTKYYSAWSKAKKVKTQ